MTVGRADRELVSHLAEKSLGKRWEKFLSTVTIVSCVVINGSVIVAAIIEIGQVLSSYFDIQVLYVKIGIISVYVFLSAVIIEPEKLKPFAYVSSGVVISISRLPLI